ELVTGVQAWALPSWRLVSGRGRVLRGDGRPPLRGNDGAAVRLPAPRGETTHPGNPGAGRHGRPGRTAAARLLERHAAAGEACPRDRKSTRLNSSHQI